MSINFWFVTPLVFPSMAPVVHPALEGLFNFVIAFGELPIEWTHADACMQEIRWKVF